MPSREIIVGGTHSSMQVFTASGIKVDTGASAISVTWKTLPLNHSALVGARKATWQQGSLSKRVLRIRHAGFQIGLVVAACKPHCSGG